MQSATQPGPWFPEVVCNSVGGPLTIMQQAIYGYPAFAPQLQGNNLTNFDFGELPSGNFKPNLQQMIHILDSSFDWRQETLQGGPVRPITTEQQSELSDDDAEGAERKLKLHVNGYKNPIEISVSDRSVCAGLTIVTQYSTGFLFKTFELRF